MKEIERKPSEVAAEAVVWALIADVATERKNEARAWLTNHLGADAAAVKAIANGDNIGRASWIEGKPVVAVLDAERFADWIQQHYPDELVTSVNPAFQKSFLAKLEVVDGYVLDAGEPVLGVGVRERAPYVSISKAKDARAKVEELLAAGRLSLDGIEQ